MQQLRPVTYREAKSKLLSLGIEEVRQQGSHVKFAKKVGDDTWTVIVPKKREVPIGTIRSMLRQGAIEGADWLAAG